MTRDPHETRERLDALLVKPSGLHFGDALDPTPRWTSHFPAIGHHRDSDTLDESNYYVARALLLDVEDTSTAEEYADVIELSARHWAVGWTETIWVRAYRDGAPTPAAEAALDLLDALASYPVLDEADYSEREHDEFHEHVAQWVDERIIGDVLDVLGDRPDGFTLETLADEEITDAIAFVLAERLVAAGRRAYVVGHNLAGYLSESETYATLDIESALDALADDIERYLDDQATIADALYGTTFDEAQPMFDEDYAGAYHDLAELRAFSMGARRFGDTRREDIERDGWSTTIDDLVYWVVVRADVDEYLVRDLLGPSDVEDILDTLDEEGAA